MIGAQRLAALLCQPIRAIYCFAWATPPERFLSRSDRQRVMIIAVTGEVVVAIGAEAAMDSLP